jgi:tartrate/fumarate subfamily iron-sulfur-dependent hydro-lyase alpha chain
VGIAGIQDVAMSLAKCQLFRKIEDENKNKKLASLEDRLLRDVNELGIGPMGFGGKTTALAVKVGYAHRHPASFFVAVAYMCWACRRHTLRIRL